MSGSSDLYRLLAHEDLPLGDNHVIEITPEKAGEYGYSCGMNMMHGQMIVE